MKLKNLFLKLIFIMGILSTQAFADIILDQKFFCHATKFYHQKSITNNLEVAANYCEKIKESSEMRITCLAMVHQNKDLAIDCPSDYSLCQAMTDENFTFKDCDKKFTKVKGKRSDSYHLCRAYKAKDTKFCKKINRKNVLHHTCMAMIQKGPNECELIGKNLSLETNPLGKIESVDEIVSAKDLEEESFEPTAKKSSANKKSKVKKSSAVKETFKSAEESNEEILNLEF